MTNLNGDIYLSYEDDGLLWDLARELELVILRRLYEGRVEGGTLCMSNEMAVLAVNFLKGKL